MPSFASCFFWKPFPPCTLAKKTVPSHFLLLLKANLSYDGVRLRQVKYLFESLWFFFCHRECCFIAKELITLVRCEHVVFASLPCSYYCFIALLLLQSHDMFHCPVFFCFSLHYCYWITRCYFSFDYNCCFCFITLPMVLFNCSCCSKLRLLLHR